jgi:uncharacterized membrane protein
MSLSRPLHWLLFASLALNLFFVGVLAAYQLRGTIARPQGTISGTTQGATPGTPLGAQLRVEQLAETLPKADAALLDRVFRTHAAELSEYTAAIRQSQDRQRDGFRAQPFDPKPVETAMLATRFNHDAAKRVVHEVILQAAAQMSPEGRAKLADWAGPPPIDASVR